MKLYLLRPIPAATDVIGLEPGTWGMNTFMFRRLRAPNKGMALVVERDNAPSIHLIATTGERGVYIDHEDRYLPKWFHAKDDAAAAVALRLPVDLVPVFYATDNFPPFWTLFQEAPK